MTNRDERSGQKQPDPAELKRSEQKEPDQGQLERSGQKQQQQERGLEQPGHQGLPHQEEQASADKSQTQQPRPTWSEQTPELDQQRAIGGGGSSSDSDGQQLTEDGGGRPDEDEDRSGR